MSSAICFSFRISSLSFCSSVKTFFFAALGFLVAAFFFTAFLAGFLALGLAAFLVVEDFLVVEELFGFVVVFLVVVVVVVDLAAAGERKEAEKLIERTEGAARRRTRARVARPENCCHGAAAPELVSARWAAARPAEDSILIDRAIDVVVFVGANTKEL